jgi:hypothetical protein
VAVLPAAPPPLVDVRPVREVRTLSPVNGISVDGGRASTLVGTTHGWEYLLVWSPKGIVIRASLNCDLQETNVVLAGNRFAHVCSQDQNYVVTGTLRPLKARVSLRTASFVSLAGRGALVAGSSGRTIWRFDPARRTSLRTYAKPAIVLDVDRDRILVERSAAAVDVVSRTGRVLATLTLPHGGGALMRGGRIAAISKRRLVVSDLEGRRVLARTVAAGAHLEDVDSGLVVYSVETRLHLFRLADGRDVALRLRGQFGYASAGLWRGGLFYAYDVANGKTGRAGFVSAVGIRKLLSG